MRSGNTWVLPRPAPPLSQITITVSRVSHTLTDDIIPLIPPPLSGSYIDWQITYSRYAVFLSVLKRLSFEYADLSLNLEKSGLLLPRGAPLPSDEVRSKFPPSFDFQLAGVRIAGSPIGTDVYMHAL